MNDCCAHAAAAAPAQLAMLFSSGVLMSVSHCLGMCGPIVAVVAVSQSRVGSGASGRAAGMLLYHTGRVASYGLIGLAMGLAGAALRQDPLGPAIQGWLSLVMGALMFFAALGVLHVVPSPAWAAGGAAPALVRRAMTTLFRSPRRGSAVLLGMANGFLPCGPVAAVSLTAAATAEPLLGLRAMLVYGAGTIPALVLLGFGLGSMTVKRRTTLFRAGGVLLIGVALQMVLRGLHALGVSGGMHIGAVILW